jgi:hypothetical protein
LKRNLLSQVPLKSADAFHLQMPESTVPALAMTMAAGPNARGGQAMTYMRLAVILIVAGLL